MHKRTKTLQFIKKDIQEMLKRDEGCIFCKVGYHLPPEPPGILDPAHIVNKSQGGLGIPQNGVIACRWHHGQLDNGNLGMRDEMQSIIETYMKSIYIDWNKENLYYRKGGN